MKAETIAKALSGRKAGGAWMACCPAHEDRAPSLSITNAKGGKVLVRCHAGCDQGRVIAALRSRGLWDENRHRQLQFMRPAPSAAAHDRPDRDDAKRSEMALVVWQAATPAELRQERSFNWQRAGEFSAIMHLTIPPLGCRLANS